LAPRVLVYFRATAYRHESTLTAVAAIAAALSPLGIASETSEDVSIVTPAQLSRFGAVVVVSPSGEPFGRVDSSANFALVEFVRGGGGLVGVHSVDSAYGCGMFSTLVGCVFAGHPGNVRTATCRTEGAHAVTSGLAPQFDTADEFHAFNNFRPDNIVVLRCDAVDGTTRLPIAWVRAEGAGRVFVNTLGHPVERWNDAAWVAMQIVPGIRWVLRR